MLEIDTYEIRMYKIGYKSVQLPFDEINDINDKRWMLFDASKYEE